MEASGDRDALDGIAVRREAGGELRDPLGVRSRRAADEDGRPTTSTSPPSRVAGAVIRAIGRSVASVVSTSGSSPRRDAAPGRVITATSSNTTAVSSMKTESGKLGAAGTRCTVQPRVARSRS